MRSRQQVRLRTLTRVLTRSRIGLPDTWMVVELHPGVGRSVVFRGTYCECLKRAEEIATRRPLQVYDATSAKRR